MEATSPRPESWAPGWAVRRDWPDGCHEFVRFEVSEEAARAFVPGDRRYWLRAMLRPVHSVVVIGVGEFEAHRRRNLCQSADCPRETPAAGAPAPAGANGATP